jgi:hypothetical protein
MGSAVGTLAGAALGSVVPGVGTALGASLGGAAGSLLGGKPNVSGAYGGASAQQLAAAQQASNMAQFRPVGITTRFGQSNFELNPEGQLVSAGYTVDPTLRAIQDRLLAQATSYDPTQVAQQAQAFAPAAQRLFGLGEQYLATSPEQARQDYMATQLAALEPSRERQLSGIRNRLFQTGRTGLATGGTATQAASNPELQAYYNALAQQDLQLAASAEQAAQQRAQFGSGLFGTAGSLLAQIPGLTTAGYSPLQTQLGLAGTIENLGMQPLDLGAQLGGRSAQAGAAAGQLLSTGTSNAALTGLAGQVAQQGINATRNTALTNQLSSVFANPEAQSAGKSLLGSIMGVPSEVYNYGYNPFRANFGGFDLNSGTTPGLWSDLSFD